MENAEELFGKLHSEGELTDEMLEDVAGGYVFTEIPIYFESMTYEQFVAARIKEIPRIKGLLDEKPEYLRTAYELKMAALRYEKQIQDNMM